MPELQTTSIALILALLGLLGTLFFVVRQRKTAELGSRLQRVSKARLENFLIPDGEGGEIHIEHALLCGRGIVVLDYKDVDGNIFGSDSMQDWTVITGSKRFTFANPQHGLFDRTAAVVHLLPEVPVAGFVAFSERGRFTKGLPSHVINIDVLLKQLANDGKGTSATLDAWWPAWEKRREEAVTAQVARLIED